jgi:hypothetical protein
MIRRFLLFVPIIITVVSGCAMYQSIVKSSFPYTSTLTISSAAQPGTETWAVNMANSFDQNFARKGNDADKITLVRVINAKLMATNPADYNIGNISSVKIYLSKEDGSDEVLIAQRDNISETAGNEVALITDNSKFLDQLVRERNIRVRMMYKVRQSVNRDVNVQVVLGLSAYPKPVDRS